MDGKLIDETLDAILAEYDRQGPAMLHRARLQAVAAHMKMVAETTFARELGDVDFETCQRAALLISVATERLLTRLLAPESE
jgi:hypothetical protein